MSEQVSFLLLTSMIITSSQHFKLPPNKIVSLIPSQTELLSYFGLDEEVAGITKFCVHPKEWFTTKQRVGGTKNVNIPIIKKLHPDLIIANKEENVKEQVEDLANEFPVWITDVNNLKDALAMIKDIGELTHKVAEAQTLITRIETNFSQLQTSSDRVLRAGTNHKPGPTGSSGRLQTAYLIWQKPFMAAGGDTFINDMMKHCGLQNIFENKNRYPEISIDDLSGDDCQLILLSSEPYPFKQKHVAELQQQLTGKKILLVDGEMFSWYGSRLLQSPTYFKSIIRSLGH